MATGGGSIEAASIRGRLFPVGADSDLGNKLGGFENELEPNGNGSVRQVKKRVAWMVDNVVLAIDDDKADHEFLQEIADSPDNVTINFTLASGVTYQGKGTIVGEIKRQTMNGTATVSFGGPGKLTQQ